MDLVVEILIIMVFLIFGAYKLIKTTDVLMILAFSVPLILMFIAAAIMSNDNIDTEARLAGYVICAISIIAYIAFMLYKAHKEPTEEEKQKEKQEREEKLQKQCEEFRERLRNSLAEQGYDYSDDVMDIVMSPGSPVYLNSFTVYGLSRWLWHKCMSELLELSTAEFEERLGYNIQEHTPDEMKPIRYPDHFNIKQALRMAYLVKKGVPMEDFKEMDNFLSYYPYCRSDFLKAFDLPSPIDENGDDEYARELKLMNETPIKKNASGCFYWDYPITKPKINL